MHVHVSYRERVLHFTARVEVVWLPCIKHMTVCKNEPVSSVSAVRVWTEPSDVVVPYTRLMGAETETRDSERNFARAKVAERPLRRHLRLLVRGLTS